MITKALITDTEKKLARIRKQFCDLAVDRPDVIHSLAIAKILNGFDIAEYKIEKLKEVFKL